MLSINEAKYVGGYSLYLIFNNGKEGVANLKQTIFDDKRPIFSELKEESNFSNFKVAHTTVVWFNELDLSPEYLFYLIFKEDKNLQKKFKDWGYLV